MASVTLRRNNSWMFADHPDKTFARDSQLLLTAVTRLLVRTVVPLMKRVTSWLP